MKLTMEEIDRIREHMEYVSNLREGKARARITVRMGPDVVETGSRDVVKAFLSLIRDSGAADVILTARGCAGGCEDAPAAVVEVEGKAAVTYGDLDEDKVKEIFEKDILGGKSVLERGGDQRGEGAGKDKRYRTNLMLCAGTGCVSNNSLQLKELLQDKDISRLVEEHLLKGNPVEEFMFKADEKKGPIPKMHDIGFFKKQKLVALANRGVLDPENIDEYIGRKGYSALARVLTSMTPQEVIETVIASGLRGRGGGGFPTGKKWEVCRKQPGDEKYLICNADEGDPGAFMDRSIVESDPHSVIEGMLIGAYAIGSSQGFVYIRDEYPLALKRLKLAIAKAREYELLGEKILGSEFSFDIQINRGAGAFVCGEETSLIHSLEGENPEPRTKPPFPAVSGYMGKPTNINNVETWSTIPHIMRSGAEWFSGIGTETSKGTKVFSVVGKVKNTGLVEVPMGITMRDVVYDIGGGIPNGKRFKAVQIGGPSGGCIPEHLIDTPIDYESLNQAGAIMGSGGLIVMDEETCMVEVAKYFLSFTQDESCGKCPPCREGTRHMYNILKNITEGRGQEGDVELLEKMAHLIKATAICGLGQTAPNPVLTTIRYFRDEYDAHIKNKRCPARVCKPLITYTILEKECTGCHACFKNCPSDAIVGEVKALHTIIQEKCIKCGMCFEVCRFNAVRYE
jgi:NADH:ubiquinone oxidoreductase subunit F (NADH-binding)/(2Fe-2S) ferredoxin